MNRVLGILTSVWLAGLPAHGQTTGRIEGRCVDPERLPLAGVTVTATSPRLPGARVAATGEDGSFRFPALPPGRYVVSADLEGLHRVEVEDVRVSLDRTVTLELVLLPPFEDALTVAGTPPILDVTGTTTGARFAAEVFLDLPTSRTFEGLALAAPAVVDGGLEQNPSIRGASAAENRFLVDGIDITDPKYGTLSSSLVFELVDELEVKTGGYEAEYGGATGGVINVVTRSGGNELKGDLFAFYSDDSLQAVSPATSGFGRRLGFSEYDFGFDVGGKLVEDRLWFFAAVNPRISEESFATRQEIPVTADGERLTWAAKLTWQIDSGHRLVASAFGESYDVSDAITAQGAQFDSLNAAGRFLHTFTSDAESYALDYSAILGGSLFGEVIAGRYELLTTLAPLSDASPWYTDLSGAGFWAAQQGCGDPDLLHGGSVNFTIGCEGGAFFNRLPASRNQLKAALTWLSRRHEVKTGFEVRRSSFRDTFHSPGSLDRPFVDSLGTVVDPGGILGANVLLFPGPVYAILEFDQDSLGVHEELALFVQDHWRPTASLAVSLGVRIDSLDARGEVARVEFDPDEMIAPRFGFAWDWTGDGRSKLYGHLGRFYEAIPVDFTARSLGGGVVQSLLFLYPFDRSFPTLENPGIFLGSDPILLAVAVDPATEPMYLDEAHLGVELEVRPGLALGAALVHRELGDIVEDVSLDGASTFFVTNPGGRYEVNLATGEALPVPVDFPQAERSYRALELTLDRRPHDGWQLFASYVYSESEGNYSGVFDPTTGLLSSHWSPSLDRPETPQGSVGPLPTDRPHQLKLYGSYRWPFGLVLGLFAQSLSGTPINKLGSWEGGGFFMTRLIQDRGTAGRTPSLRQLDLHLEYPFELDEGRRLSLIVDLFNLTDEQSAVALEQIWTFAPLDRTEDPDECGGPGSGPGTACPFGNPQWGTATAFQRPRTARLGAKLSW